MEKVILTGKLGHDPEMKKNNEGKTFVTFSLATTSGYGASKKTKWWSCSINEKMGANVLQYTQKGSKVLVEGIPDVNAYQDKKTNSIVGQLKVYVHSIEFLDKKFNDNNGPDGDAYTLPEVSNNTHNNGSLSSDDVPF